MTNRGMHKWYNDYKTEDGVIVMKLGWGPLERVLSRDLSEGIDIWTKMWMMKGSQRERGKYPRTRVTKWTLGTFMEQKLSGQGLEGAKGLSMRAAKESGLREGRSLVWAAKEMGALERAGSLVWGQLRSHGEGHGGDRLWKELRFVSIILILKWSAVFTPGHQVIWFLCSPEPLWTLGRGRTLDKATKQHLIRLNAI